MTMLNRVRSATLVAVEVVAGTKTRAAHSCLALARRLTLSLLAGLLIAAGAIGLALPASANNAPVGSVSMGSPGSGRMISTSPTGARHTRSILSLHRFGARRERFEAREAFARAREFRRFHHRGRDVFADAFFPFGFFGGLGWPFTQPDLAVVATDEGDQADWRTLPFWVRVDRYEPPTVEKAPSGVTIIRGPGSHHGLLLP